jgi:predicted transcriptional regulator
MPLTVRLDPALERALDVYCTTQGVSKSLVVQESLARYLVGGSSAQRSAAQSLATADAEVLPSAHWLAFERAGLIGCIGRDGEHDAGTPADKAAVRAKAAERRAR